MSAAIAAVLRRARAAPTVSGMNCAQRLLHSIGVPVGEHVGTPKTPKIKHRRAKARAARNARKGTRHAAR